MRFQTTLLLLPLAVSLAAGCSRPPAQTGATVRSTPAPVLACAPGTADETIVSGGVTRAFRLHVPANLPQGAEVPLVLAFHGAGGTGEGLEAYTRLTPLADEKGFIIAYPQALGALPTWDTWKDSGDVQFMRDLLDRLEAACPVDPARVYAVGHSRGGGMADRLGCDLADRIAAFGGVSGAYTSAEDCFPVRPVPLIAIHGAQDPDVPYNGISPDPGMRTTYFTIGIPIPQWASAWAARDGCGVKSTVFLQQGELSGQRWGGCAGGAEVVLYTLAFGQHGWPDGTATADPPVDASRMLWDFLSGHTLPATE